MILKNQKKEQKQPIKQEISVSESVVAEEIDKDSDNDGLKDWEESLWGTDPNNPDTDKDGAPDGQEVKENRNPLLAGDGKTDKIENLKPKKSPPDQEQTMQLPSTLTEAFGQEFFSEYMRLKQGSGEKLGEDDKTGLVNYLMSALNNFQNKTSDYSKSDIKIASADDENSIKEYNNNLTLIIKKYFDPLPKTELMAIFAKALEENKENELNKLEPTANAFRNTAREIVSLSAPPSLADSHLKLANYFNNIAQEINGMQKFFKDPMQALLALKQYQTDSEQTYSILQSLYQ